MADEHGPEMQRLLDRLFNDPNRTLCHFNVWWGEKAHELTTEERAKVLNNVFDQEASGNVTYGLPESTVPKINVIEYLKTLK